MEMQIKINGKIEELNQNMTLSGILAEKNISIESIAVALNQEVIPRSLHAQTLLNDGDEVEIIRAVAGG